MFVLEQDSDQLDESNPDDQELWSSDDEFIQRKLELEGGKMKEKEKVKCSVYLETDTVKTDLQQHQL